MIDCPGCRSDTLCTCAAVSVQRAAPTLRGRRNSREHFEKLIIELTGCRVDDGTLEIDDNRSYKNQNIQYLWVRYQNK